MSSISVLLADDHTIVREGIRALLQAQSDISVVGEATDGREAVAQALTLHPDVVVMDIAMPGLNGIEATRQLRQNMPTVRVVILSMYDNEEYVAQVLRAGASGYVLKRAAAADLVTAIRAAYAGESFLQPSIASSVIAGYVRNANSSASDAPEHLLTAREREVLQLIAEARTNKDIAETLSISINTVETHRAHILEKLGVHSRDELVKHAIRLGLIPPSS